MITMEMTELPATDPEPELGSWPGAGFDTGSRPNDLSDLFACPTSP
jgi:hypothetical protein